MAQHIIDEPSCARKCRHLISDESEKFINKKDLIVDSFQYFYRPDFRCRYLDEDYVLCHVIKINDTIDVDKLPFSVDLRYASDIKVLDVNMQLIEYFRSKDNPLIYTFFGEQLFKEEYVGERDYGLINYVSYIDSCVRDSTNRVVRLFILVTNNEIPIINSLTGTMDSVLCNINRVIENQVYYSDIIYFQSDYNTKDFFSLSEWSAFLHHRIDSVGRSLKKED